MAPSRRVGKARWACKVHAKICGSDACDNKDPHRHVPKEMMMLTYLDDILVMGQPLPWGLRCQKPLSTLSKKVKALVTWKESSGPCMQPDNTKYLGYPIALRGTPMGLNSLGLNPQSQGVVAVPSNNYWIPYFASHNLYPIHFWPVSLGVSLLVCPFTSFAVTLTFWRPHLVTIKASVWRPST